MGGGRREGEEEERREKMEKRGEEGKKGEWREGEERKGRGRRWGKRVRRRKEASQRERGERVEMRVLGEVFVQPSGNMQVNEHQKDALAVVSESMGECMQGGLCRESS